MNELVDAAPEIPAMASIEAETAVLGAMLIDKAAAAYADQLLIPADFYREANRRLFRAVMRLLKRGDAVDHITITQELQRTGECDAAGGVDYIAALLDIVPTAANLEYHARIVRERADARNLWGIGARLQRDAADPEIDLAHLRVRVIEALERIPTVSSDAPGRSAAEILEDATVEDVQELAPPFAYRGRVTIVSAREKCGKTSIVAAAAAAVTARRPWLGYPTLGGTIAWWPGATESTPEDVSELVRQFGGDVTRLYIVEERGEPFALLERAARAWSPDVLVVDSLAALVADLELESGDSGGWTRVMGRLRSIAMGHDCAVVVIHHGNKTNGEYRDSTAIGASADVLVALQEGTAKEQRELKTVARWKIPQMTVQMIQPPDGRWRYELVGSGASTEALVSMHVEQNPGCSLRSVRDSVPGTHREKDDAVHSLVRSGHIENRSKGQAMALHVVGEQPELEVGR